MGSMQDPLDHSSAEGLSADYDVIVVGGGSSGLALASRLSEDPKVNVLLLEAGASHINDPTVLIPPLGLQLIGNPQYDWVLGCEPQSGLHGRQIIQNRGKGLGGSSSIHMNMVVIPPKPSIDDWKQLGNPGWDFEALAPYYKKFHTFHPPSEEAQRRLRLDYLDPKLHGTDGPIQVTYGTHQTEFSSAWAETFENLGYKSKHDPLTGQHYGGLNAPASINPITSTRSYSVSAYYNQSVTARPNFRIVTEMTIEKVVLETSDDQGCVARGVQFLDKNGDRHIIKSAETVLSAGVYGSPQVLELSGIGNPQILRDASIETKVDLPGVGENLQDHYVVGVSFETNIPSLDSLQDPAVIGAAMQEYQTSRTGILSNCVFNAAYMPIMTSTPDELSTLFDTHASSPPYTFPSQKQQYALQKETIIDPARSTVEYFLHPVQVQPAQCIAAASLSNEAKSANYMTIFAILSHPFSRGTSHIKRGSRDPIIDPRYLSHPLDAELQARHVQWVSTLIKTEPLASLLKPGGRTIPPNINLDDMDSIRKFVRTGGTTYHPAGTCAMMPRDIGGVVDERLRVHGVKGLRVVDASIYPLLPRGNLQTTVYAVAERAADLIREDRAN